jgi:hypothetical protein
MKEKVFVCPICAKKSKATPGEKIPVCCGQPMTLKLEQCTRPFVAETSRSGAVDEPCDDGTEGTDN